MQWVYINNDGILRSYFGIGFGGIYLRLPVVGLRLGEFVGLLFNFKRKLGVQERLGFGREGKIFNLGLQTREEIEIEFVHKL